MESQGHNANKNGEALEEVVYNMLLQKGYTVSRHSLKFQSIYGHDTNPDIFVVGIKGFETGLIIETKWQATGGTADEKYPYLVLNIKDRYPYPVIIVIDGGGYKLGSLEWLKNQVDGKKLIAVYGIAEILNWVNKLRKLP